MQLITNSILLSTSPRRLREWGIQFDEDMANLGLGTRSPYTRRRAQAQRLDPTVQEDWKRLSQLIQRLTEISSWSLELPDFPSLAARGDLQIKEMRRESITPEKRRFQEMLGKAPFSYAIVSQRENGLNYSLLP